MALTHIQVGVTPPPPRLPDSIQFTTCTLKVEYLSRIYYTATKGDNICLTQFKTRYHCKINNIRLEYFRN